MNFADSEVVASILKKDGYKLTDKSKDANLVLLNTCSIRAVSYTHLTLPTTSSV